MAEFDFELNDDDLVNETRGEEHGGTVFTGKITGKNSSQTAMQVVLNARVINDGGRGGVLIAAWRADGYPLGRFSASVHFYNGSDAHARENSVTAIVPPGGRWEAYSAQTHPKIETRVWAAYLK